eukprot:617003-Hanusia_phi.AAC.1
MGETGGNMPDVIGREPRDGEERRGEESRSREMREEKEVETVCRSSFPTQGQTTTSSSIAASGRTQRRRTFSFSSVAPPPPHSESDQVKNFVQSALDGYNVSLLAYGQVKENEEGGLSLFSSPHLPDGGGKDAHDDRRRRRSQGNHSEID